VARVLRDALLALFVPLSCASHRAEPLATPTGAAEATGQPGDCNRASSQARALLNEGRLWTAGRALAGCEAQAQPLLTELRESLGESRRAKRSSSPSAAQSLEAAEQQLASGDCGGALKTAEAHYQSAVPNAEAAVLAGRASACLKRPADASRWYARAHFEAELGGTASAWKLPEIPREVSWRGSSVLALSTKSGPASLSDASGKGQWVWRNLPSAVPAAPWVSGNVRVSFETDELVGKDETGEVLWRRALAPLSDVSPAFAEGQALLLMRAGNSFQISYEQLELATGKVLRSGKVEGVEPRAVVSASFASWFSFETPEPQERDIISVVVDGKGRARRQSVDKGCRPLAAWSATEFVSDCGDASALYAVDVETSQRRMLADKPPGQLGLATTLGAGLVGFTGAAGVFLLRRTEAAASITTAPELAGVNWKSVSWSPDRTHFAALGRLGEREQLVIYAQAPLLAQARWTGYADHSPPLQVGFAVSQDRAKLALGSCPELASFDLRSGAYTRAPLSECSPLLEAQGQDGFAVVDVAKKTALLGGKLPRAVSADGKYIVHQTREEQNGTVRRALVLSLGDSRTPAQLREIWSTPIQRDARAFFSRDGRTLYFLIKPLASSTPDAWQELDVPSLRVKAAARGAELEGAVELSQDGATVLRTGSLIQAGIKRELAYSRWSNVDSARADGLAFALDDRLVVGRRDREAWLWRARDGAFLGKLLTLAGGGALFTVARPKDPENAASETGLVQLFGAEATTGVACVVGQRLYAWELCADRYGDDTLFARTLSSAGN
jgi:hypothetical protein